MSHKHCDALGAVAVAGIIAGLLLTKSADQNYVLYAGLVALGAYAYVSIEVLPRRRRQAQTLAVAVKEVLPPPVPVEHQRNGHTIPAERVSTTRLPIAV